MQQQDGTDSGLPRTREEPAGASSLSRRQVLVAGAATAGAAWVAPQVLSTTAAAAATIPPPAPRPAVVTDDEGRVFVSADSGATWAPATENPPGPALPSIAFGGSRFFTVNDAGDAFLSNSDGSLWSSPSTPPNPGTGFAGVAASTSNVVAVAGTQVYRSSNVAIDWGPATTQPAGATFLRAIGTAPGTLTFLAAGTAGVNGAVWRSTDGGDTWAPATTQPTALTVARSIAVSGTNALAGDISGKVFTSSDTGQNWSGPITPTGMTFLGGVAIDGTTALAVGSNAGNTVGVWRSTDSGATWTPATTQPPGLGLLVSVALVGTTAVVADGTGKVYRSTDGGDTWINATTNPPATRLQSIALGSSGRSVVTDDEGRVYVSADSGATWAPATENPPGPALPSIAFGGSRFFTVNDAGDAFLSNSDGNFWSTPSTPPNPGTGFAGVAASTSNVVAVAGTKVYRSSNVAIDWGPATTQPAGATFLRTIGTAPGTLTFLAAGTAGVNGAVWRSTDGGDTWAPATTQPTALTVARSIAVSGTNALAGDISGKVFTSSDTGQNWSGPITPTGMTFLGGVAIDGTTALAVGSNAGNTVGVWRSTDSGATWTPATTQPPGLGLLVSVALVGTTAVVADGTGKVYRSTDGGDTWINATTNPPATRLQSIALG